MPVNILPFSPTGQSRSGLHQTGCYASLLPQTRTTSAGNLTLSQTIVIASKKIHASIMTNGTKNHTATYYFNFIFYIFFFFLCRRESVRDNEHKEGE